MLNKHIFLLGAVLALFSLAGFAQGPRGGRGLGGPPPEGAGQGPRMGGMMGGGQLLGPMMARLLDLDEAQRTAIRERLQADAEQLKPIREQRMAHRESVEQAIHSNAPDATLEQLAADGAAISATAQAISLKTRSYIYNQVLTPEQRTKLEELQQEFEGRRGMGRRGPRGPGIGAPGQPGTPPPAGPPAGAGPV